MNVKIKKDGEKNNFEKIKGEKLAKYLKLLNSGNNINFQVTSSVNLDSTKLIFSR